MSNLCHNCGNCHLPRSCDKELNICDICGNPGHTCNFCPLGISTRNPQYGFWALCHNCDEWHLPLPCRLALRKCSVCKSDGHFEYFCPVAPLSRREARDLSLKAHEEYTGVKRQRRSDSSFDSIEPQGGEPGEPTAEVIKSIKDKAVRDTLKLLDQGVPRDYIAHYVRGDQPANLTQANMQAVCGALGIPFAGTHHDLADITVPSHSHPYTQHYHQYHPFTNRQLPPIAASGLAPSYNQASTHQHDPYTLAPMVSTAYDRPNPIAHDGHFPNLTPATSMRESGSSASRHSGFSE